MGVGATAVLNSTGDVDSSTHNGSLQTEEAAAKQYLSYTDTGDVICRRRAPRLLSKSTTVQENCRVGFLFLLKNRNIGLGWISNLGEGASPLTSV